MRWNFFLMISSYPKVRKGSKIIYDQTTGTAPPERPVISGSGSITENPSRFCQHYMKQVSKDHESFIRDTCDFLRHIQDIENLPPNSVLVTIDVTGLYTQIPPDKGIKATGEALDRRKDKSVPTEFIIKLLELLT